MAATAMTSSAAVAQNTPPATQSAPAPAARPDDVRSVDAIITALYASISGKLGEKRDWDRMRSLFAPGARLIPLAPQPNGGGVPRMQTVEEYIARSGPTIEQLGFAEVEIARRSEEFGNMVHVWSTYSGTVAAPNQPPPPRGINSIQLSNDGTRWFIVNIFWESESARNPLPAKYLPPGG
jgi:hypothetical protein